LTSGQHIRKLDVKNGETYQLILTTD